MLSALRLTYRIHRFEIVVAAIVAALAAVALAYLTLQVRDIGIPDGCWPRDFEGEYGLPECNKMLMRFWDVEASGGGWARVILSFLSPILGVLLGVSIVAREVELRTAELAWSLSRRRSRWLLQRMLPMFVIALVMLIPLGVLGWWFFDALAQARHWPEMTELASLGFALVARGLMAMGVALLIGALAGRTMPALVVAVIVLVAWSLIAVPTVQHQVAQERTVWRQEGDWRTGEGELLYLRGRQFDASQPGREGEPGKRINRAERRELLRETCGSRPDSDAEVDPYYLCQEEFNGSIKWQKVVPQSEFGLLQTADAMISLLVGGGAFLLTFPVVARRRPS